MLAVLLDVMNVFNEQIDYYTNIKDVITDIYSRESAERGEQVPAFGKPWGVAPGRQARIGVRFLF